MTTLLSKDFPRADASPDVQEFLSIRYGESVFSIVPLRSGKIGVLASMREPFAICDSLEEAITASKLIPKFQYHRDVARMAPRTMKEQTQELDALIQGLDL